MLTGLKDEFQTIGGAIKETGKDFVPFAASVGKDLLGTLQNDTLKMLGGTLTGKTCKLEIISIPRQHNAHIDVNAL